MRLGVCYYPEHWPEAIWAEDARRMAEMGISRVRIGEFAWSRIEPDPGRFDWGWLDRAIETLTAAGHGVILGTPTATPPKWLVDRHPDILAVDAEGRPRRFGSRRHYCLSSQRYREECARIVGALVERYGHNPAVVAWQTDNEYGCHATTLSYSGEAARAFRRWLAARYDDVSALNAAWGAVFWSQEYRGFDEIDPPNLAVTEPNPAHVLDYRRFASDEVATFNKLQCDIIRAGSPDREITHNFMGFVTDFDHHQVAADLDLATWDSYPLGFTEQFWLSDAEKRRYARSGHPDIAAFHHDLYRGVGRGRWGVMEQQPGPVNWARHNPAPLPGMVRLWTLEAFAHGAELVSYFRWRQAPFGQEQMHAGLLRSDSEEAPGAGEVRTVAGELALLPSPPREQAEAALIFDYQSEWVIDAQPHGARFSHLRLAFEMYGALRRLGLNIDIVPSGAALDDYRIAVAPCLPIVSAAAMAALSGFDGPLLLGPRSGSKTAGFAIPPELPPGPLQRLIPLKVTRVESLRPGLAETGDGFVVERWIETVEMALEPEIALADGRPIVVRSGAVRYLAGWPDAALLGTLFERMAAEAGLATTRLPADLRTTRRGDLRFVFNHGPEPADIPPGALGDGERSWLLGGDVVPPGGVAVWRERRQCA